MAAEQLALQAGTEPTDPGPTVAGWALAGLVQVDMDSRVRHIRGSRRSILLMAEPARDRGWFMLHLLWAEAAEREDLMDSNGIRLLLADVDGTLVTPDKVLTERAIDAVRGLGKAGILFAITSGRPPRGMSMLIDPLDITTPIAAFNGGLLVSRDMSVIEQRVLPEQLVRPVAELIGSFGLDVWVYRGADWYVPDPRGSHVARESATVRFGPEVMASLDGLTSDVAKLVGVSDDLDAVARATSAAHDRFGDHVTAARSQPYYLDVTHPDANKGAVARYLSAKYSIPPQAIATIGDMPNDVLMFAHSGLSIAMGNASPDVQRAARRVTSSNSTEGFANAVERFILPGG